MLCYFKLMSNKSLSWWSPTFLKRHQNGILCHGNYRERQLGNNHFRIVQIGQYAVDVPSRVFVIIKTWKHHSLSSIHFRKSRMSTGKMKQLCSEINGIMVVWKLGTPWWDWNRGYERSISNFLCSLTRNSKSHSVKNLAFHSLLGWKMIILYQFSLPHFWEIVLFELGSERAKVVQTPHLLDLPP